MKDRRVHFTLLQRDFKPNQWNCTKEMFLPASSNKLMGSAIDAD